MNAYIEKNKKSIWGGLNNYLVLLFIFWPFAALIYGLKRFQTHMAMSIFFIFCIFYGFSFIVISGGEADSARYAKALIELHNEPLSFNQLTELFYKKGESVDIYQKLITWTISLVTSDTKYLFAVFAMVFGYFYTRNLWIIYSKISIKLTFVFFLLLLAYAVINPIWNINGVRMWTAAHIFIYGTLRYILDNDRKQIIWILSSFLVHASLLLPISIFFIFLFVPNNLKTLFIFFGLTLFVSEIDFGLIRKILSYLPDIFQAKYTGYLNESYADKINVIRENSTWHVKIAGEGLKLFKIVWITYSYIIIKNDSHEAAEKGYLKPLFAFALFLGGFANITSLIPSGGRFIVLANMLFFAVFILLYNYSGKLRNMKYIHILTAPALLFWVLFTFRMGFDYMSIQTIFGNIFTVMFFDAQTRLIDFVKAIF